MLELMMTEQESIPLGQADRADVELRPSVGQTDVVGEDVLVVDQPVLRRVGVGIAGVGPDWMRLGALGDHEPAVVTVEARLDTVRGREGGRDDLEVVGRLRVAPAGQVVVSVAGRGAAGPAGPGGGEAEAARRGRVLTGDPLGPEIADPDP